MEPDTQAVFYLIALVCFVVAAIFVGVAKGQATRPWWKILVAAGLASWVFVNFWTAVQA